ncbi:IclR family transcriptional regulator, partial [Mesorhizobium sp. M2A.F.Ca.ET.042.01.1.1]|uniref:IclR family transcriptional regulator n=1 Tax=Mesorhizobium sp. M2A.F.Ca.ET.042.01.1.1 TaxID=2496745 RepID=UPI000FD35696
MSSNERASGKVERSSGEVTTVQRALDVLKTVGASDKPIGVNEIARRLGKHASAVSRTLATLEHNGYVQRDDETGRFGLGGELIALASKHLAELDVVRVARPFLEKLAEDARETSSLSLWTRNEAINIEQALGPGAIKHIAAPGRHNPAHCTATGKAILAHMPASVIDQILGAGMPSHTAHTITDKTVYENELRKVAEQGYAVSVGEFILEVASIAVAIFDRGRKPIAAIAISMPAFHFDEGAERRLAPLVVEAAAAIFLRLG